MSQRGGGGSRRALRVALVLVFLALTALLAWSSLGAELAPHKLRAFLRGADIGAGGPIYVGSAVILACLFVPTPLIMATAGLWFGVPLGLLLALLSLSASAAIQTSFTRRATRARVRLDQRPWEAAVSRLTAERSWRSVVALRIAPAIPFALSNYWLGLTLILARTVLYGSLVGLIPRTALYVVLGDAIGSASTSESAWALAVLVTINVCGAIIAAVALRRAYRVLD